MRTINAMDVRPREGWITICETAHPRDDRRGLLIRHAGTGRYALDDGASIRSVPQAWARERETTYTAAAALGRKGGSVSTAAKSRAARANGRKGGRPHR